MGARQVVARTLASEVELRYRAWIEERRQIVELINGWSGSGGDAFPTYFKQAGLGPLIGTRTWGGLIGISGAPPLVDGGTVSVPTFRMYDPKGTWFREGHGVDPDIEVWRIHRSSRRGPTRSSRARSKRCRTGSPEPRSRPRVRRPRSGCRSAAAEINRGSGLGASAFPFT